jgi:hypothetical protein
MVPVVIFPAPSRARLPTNATGELMAAVSPAIIMIVCVPDRLDAEYEVCACTGDGLTIVPEIEEPLPPQDTRGKASKLSKGKGGGLVSACSFSLASDSTV